MSLLCRSAVKKLALEVASARHHEFGRVSKEYLDWIEGRVRELVESSIRSLPSKGKTIYPPVRTGKESE